MRNRQEGWLAAVGVAVVTAAMVVTDLTDDGFSAWWARHAFTASVTGGILVLAVTVLIADRVVAARALTERSQAIAAQAAIVMSQAARATRAVKTALEPDRDDGDVDAAADELRTYMTMLLLSSSLLIDAHVSRTFLEQAQLLARDLARGVAAARSGEGTDPARRGLDAAVAHMREVSRPLLDQLDLESRVAVSGDDPVATEPEAA